MSPPENLSPQSGSATLNSLSPAAHGIQGVTLSLISHTTSTCGLLVNPSPPSLPFYCNSPVPPAQPPTVTHFRTRARSPQQSRFQRELVPKQGREFHVDPTAGPPLREVMFPPGPAFSLLCISTALTVPLPSLRGGGLGGQWGKHGVLKRKALMWAHPCHVTWASSSLSLRPPTPPLLTG